MLLVVEINFDDFLDQWLEIGKVGCEFGMNANNLLSLVGDKNVTNVGTSSRKELNYVLMIGEPNEVLNSREKILFCD